MLLSADIDPETFGTFYEAFKEVLHVTFQSLCHHFL